MNNFGFLSIVYFCVVCLLNSVFGSVSCIDCSFYFKDKCTVTTTDVQLHEDDQDHLTRSEQDNPAALSKCLPPGYWIKGDLSKVGCGMSPKLGCNVITTLIRSYTNKNSKMCEECASACGCEVQDDGKSDQYRNLPSSVIKGWVLASCLTLICMNH